VSEDLSEEEQLARLKTWWGENGTTLVVAVVVAVATIAGWQWYDTYSETQMHEASDAYVSYLRGEDDAVNNITADHEGSAFHVLVLFDQAKEAVQEGDLVQAEALLEAAVELDSGALLGDLARIRLARVQHGLDRSDAAFATLQEAKSTGYRAFALEVKGDIHSALGELEAAYQSYQAAVDALREGEERTILSMKLNNAAPYEGEFFQPQNSLADALEAAQETLGAAIEGEDTNETTVATDSANDTPTPLPSDDASASEETDGN